ncbi:MAG: M1 family metallopeptidase, partial [Anaerolineae bacterium]|nr:M1 family metallopeptidase [Anaerolineae bacterium]
MIFKSLVSLIFILLTLPACTAWPAIVQPSATPTDSVLALSLTPTSGPTLLPIPTTPPLPPTVTPIPTTPPSPTANMAESNFADLSPYYQAMRPEYVGDVDQVAAAGATHYYIEATLDFPSGDTGGQVQLIGSQQVRYTNNESIPLDDIYFRLYPNLPGYGGQMTVNTVIVNNQPVTPTLEADGTVLRAPLPSPLLPGEVATITLDFDAQLPNQPQNGYNIFSYSNGTAALADFYPAVAVYDDEGWDIDIPPSYGDATYLDTALFQVKLTVPEAMVVAASGSLIDSQTNGNGTKTLALVSGPMRDFYIAMREDFQFASETVNGVTVNSYYPPDLAEGGQLALRYAADALTLFNERFGPYPYAEFDVVATPTTAGGVEYPGIVVVSENLYGQIGGFFEHATVHEVAHQWWYSLVGNDQIDDPWLDESLTNYSTVFYWEAYRGSDAAESVIEGFFTGPYKAAQERVGDRAVTGPVSAYTEGEYSAFIYG